MKIRRMTEIRSEASSFQDAEDADLIKDGCVQENTDFQCTARQEIENGEYREKIRDV